MEQKHITIEQLNKYRDDLIQQLNQALQAETQAVRQRAMIEGALQLVEIQIGRLQPEIGKTSNDVTDH